MNKEKPQPEDKPTVAQTGTFLLFVTVYESYDLKPVAVKSPGNALGAAQVLTMPNRFILPVCFGSAASKLPVNT